MALVETDLHESPSYWDSVAAGWTGRARDAVWRAHVDAVNAALLDRWLPRAGLRHVLKTDLFDEAVAKGLYPILRRRANVVTGIDISPRVVHAAQMRYPTLDAAPADVRQLPFEDGTFDLAVSLSTLDHFDSRDEIRAGLAEIARVIAPGGALILTLDNASNPAVALRNRLPYPLLHRIGVVPYFVGATCSARSLKRLLRSSEFELRDLGFILHCPRVVAVLAARAVDRFASDNTRNRFLRLLLSFEELDRWPIRALTGYFVAAYAVKL